jgi:tRNA (cytidine56-2'-O)-methyltransferase
MISILRLGHRPQRDKRITTHVGLVARALGADRLLIPTKDLSIKKTIDDVTNRFGGEFEVETGLNWRNHIKTLKGTIVHLTMYGEHIDCVLDKIPEDEDLLLVIGAEKVPGEIYGLADYNVAVGNQPHSEIAALAIFLDRFKKGKGLKKEFDGKMKIIPTARGKEVVTNDKETSHKG